MSSSPWGSIARYQIGVDTPKFGFDSRAPSVGQIELWTQYLPAYGL